MSDVYVDTASPLREGGINFKRIKKVIGVISGKGGVGKSLVTAMLAVAMRRMGKSTGILDADLTGPTIPVMFGVGSGIVSDHTGMGGSIWRPVLTRSGIQVISVNCLLDDQTDPVLWGGQALIATLKRFWVGVAWNDVDYLFIDMPPGTGDVAMTVFQSFPVDGVVIVTSPQELVGIMVEKSIKMVNHFSIPILGIVQNMSYYECPTCHERSYIFGERNASEIAEKYGISRVAELPFDQNVARIADAGYIEEIDTARLVSLIERLTTGG